MSYRRRLLAAIVLLLPIFARAQIAGTLDTNFVAQLARVSGGAVNKVLVQPDGKILIAGRFAVVGGETRRGIARLEANGAVESTNTFDPGAGVSDEIFSMALQSDGKILIGGDFTRVNGTNRARIARLNADGSLDTTFDPGTGAVSSPAAVYALVVQPDNKILVAGRFNTMNGEARTNLVRLEPNGAVESLATFNPGLGTTGPSSVGTIFALALQPDGKILIGGQFTNVNGQARSRIARLHADGSVEDVATFNPGSGADGTVRSLAVDADGKILVSGGFANFNGVLRRSLARLNPDGSPEADATFNPGTGAQDGFSSGIVDSAQPQPDGKILISGRFTSFNGIARANVARLNADGSVEGLATFDPGSGTSGPFGNARVYSLALQTNGSVVLGGQFTAVNGQLRRLVARLRTDGSLESDLEFHAGLTGLSVNPGIANAIAVQPDGRILVGGQFQAISGRLSGSISRLFADGRLDKSFDPGTGTSEDAPVFAVAVQNDGKILLGGQFNAVNGENRYRLARLHPNGRVESTETFHPQIASPSQVNCLALQADGKILIGGTFTVVEGQPRRGIARLHDDGSLDTTFNPATGVSNRFGGAVYTMAIQADGAIMIGGDFTSVSGQARTNLARLNPDGSLQSLAQFANGTGANGSVRSLLVQADGRVLVGGSFTNLNGEYRNGLARLEPNGSVEGTATFDPAGAQAGSSGGAMGLQADGRIVLPSRRLLASGASETTATFDVGLGASGPVNGLALQADGRILLIGSFTAVNGEPRHGLARLLNDPASASLTTSSNQHVRWTRSGPAPEISYATFELSINGGETWALLGAGTRTTNGWELSGIELPANGLLRARGRTTGAEAVGSAGLVENQLTIETAAPELRFSEFNATPAPNGGTGRTIRATVEGGPAAAGLSLELQASSDLDVWTTIATTTASTEGVASFELVDSFEGEQRFYRVIRP